MAEPFLGIARSLRGRAWRERPGDTRAAAAIAQSQGISDIAARVLANRGVTPETAASFLKPQLRTSLPDPSCLGGMDRAAERLAEAVAVTGSVEFRQREGRVVHGAARGSGKIGLRPLCQRRRCHECHQRGGQCRGQTERELTNGVK